MNSIVTGLNKLDVYCEDPEGKTVVVNSARGHRTMTQTFDEMGHAYFYIPAVPAPEREKYRIRLMNNGQEEYTTWVDLGYGDSVLVELSDDARVAKMRDINDVEDELDELEQRLIGRITYGTTDLADGSSPLQSGYLYCYI